MNVSAGDASDWLDDDEEDDEEILFPVYPENVQALEVFISMSTQWRMVGTMQSLHYTGLDYSVLGEMWLVNDVKKKDRPKVFEQLRILERAAMPILNGSKK